ncbi:MAG: hypothetical protein H7Z12_17600 [Rhodospirillaceae bacterium]|nr:hypothetical protein [Rhodospirillales bacterium]
MPETTTSPMISPPFYARLDPPAEVVASVAAVRVACNGWELTKLGTDTPLTFSSEAELCDQLTGRTHPAETSFGTGIVLGVSGTLIAIGICIVIRDVYRGLCGLARTHFRRRSSA